MLMGFTIYGELTKSAIADCIHLLILIPQPKFESNTVEIHNLNINPT